MSNQLMDADEMAQSMIPNRRLSYKEESDILKSESLAADIDVKIDALKRTTERGKVDFSDLHQVQERTFEYMAACKKATIYPSAMGLASLAYGYSTRGMNKYLAEHPDEPSAQFIELVKSSFADILTNAALFRNADTTQVIFQLKNQNNFVDRVQLEPIQPTSPLGESADAQALMERYQDLPED